MKKHLGRYKILIAIGFGVLGFWLNLHAVNFVRFPHFKASILAGLLFPLLVALAWGWKYGLLSALAGGCQSLWWLWQSDGYGALYAVPVFTAWVVWHGAWSDYRRAHPASRWYHSRYIVELLFRIVSEAGFYTIFRWLVSLNPPPWAPEISWTEVEYAWVHFVVIKHLVTAYILLLFSDVLLNLGWVRQFFRLRSQPAQRSTSYAISASILLGACLWVLDTLVVYLAFYEGDALLPDALVSGITARDLFTRNLFFLVALIAGLLVARFLAKRLETEEALRESEQRLIAAQRIARMGDFTWDVDTGNVVWSDGLFELLGYQKSDGIDYAKVNADIHHPDDLERITLWLNACLTSGQAELTPNEYRLLHKDGHMLFVRTTGVIEREPGKSAKVFATVRNITERKQAEEKLRIYQEHLEDLVKRRTAELEAKNQELETFTYSVSHDLKAPLRAIDGYSRFLLDDYFDRMDEDGRAFLQNIRNATIQMHQLIEDLLTYSRLERREIKTAQVDPRCLIETLIAEHAPEIEQQKVTLTIDVPFDSIAVDIASLKQVLRNLLDNALKFTQNSPEPHIDIGGRETAETHLLWIRDNGIGFDMQYHQRIFDIFQRLNRAEDYPGTGIGLAIVRKALQRMGGRVWAESEPGAGATFFVEFQRSDSEEANNAPAIKQETGI